MSKLIKISKLYKDLGVTRQTIFNWRKNKLIDVVTSPGGHVFVTEETYNILLGINKNNSERNDNLQNNKSD